LRLEINPLIAAVSTIEIGLSMVILIAASQLRLPRLASGGRGNIA
jgi:hypothetical protein